MKYQEYISILGRQPELGLVELESVLGADNVQPFGRQAALMSEAVHVDRLGGTVKVAQVLYRGPVAPLRHLPVNLSELPIRGEGKTPFAISAYGTRDTPRMLMAAGLQLKKSLRESGHSSLRLVMAAKGLAVSAAQLHFNRVIEDGFELVVVVAAGEMVVARTLGVQDINWYSKRDYDRPARSAKVGMLPPKLAQILVNTVQAPLIYDPFCGTGVVLQEALLMERAAQGSDLAEEMVAATRTNLEWLQQQVFQTLPKWQAALADARDAQLPKGCAVVSEGYLGPNLVHSPSLSELAPVRMELKALYTDVLQSWASQLPAGGEVSLCVPAWHIGKSWHYLGLVDELARLGYTLKSFRGQSGPLLYAREDQVVGRQLLLFRKS